jgi:pimeloyl-ACP methyl ester carboxylesterase
MKHGNRTWNRRLARWLLAPCGLLAAACSSDAKPADGNSSVLSPGVPIVSSNGPVTTAGTSAVAAGSAVLSAGTSATLPPVTNLAGSPAPTKPAAPMNTFGGGGRAALPPTTPAAGSAAAPLPAAPPGPDDGDPSKPVVALSDVKCKAGTGGFGLSGANFKVDNRDVIIDYPCNKHEGAPMTFILNLHGTTPVAQHFYQEGYFSAFKYAASHNLIIATPSAVDTQWGNKDNGADLPYLMNVIDWVYKNLGTKFDIRSMWVGGHSWGAMYTATFGCKPELADKVRGLIIMSGLPTLPACWSKMSVIDTNAEMDIAMPLNQANAPMTHGCKEPQMTMLGNNTQTLWPDCNAGFVHSNYLMLGKMHADFMDDVVVKSIVDLIKSVRP